jgi:hypothetical protein
MITIILSILFVELAAAIFFVTDQARPVVIILFVTNAFILGTRYYKWLFSPACPSWYKRFHWLTVIVVAFFGLAMIYIIVTSVSRG